jgi:anti-sigma regulatory factor (Ser/Thr protein kinase)
MEALRVPATLDSLGPISRYVIAASEQAGIDRRAAYKLRLAVVEIATNAVMHGRSGGDGNDAIELTARVDDESLTIVLDDPGPPFNPIVRGEPGGLARPIDEREVGGLGIFLAIRSVDRFDYERVGAINRNIFVVHRGASVPGEAR